MQDRSGKRGYGCLALRQLGVLALGVCAGFAVQAQELAANASPLRVSGFATLGLTYHDNGEAGPISRYSQKALTGDGVSGNLDTVGGLQLDWRLRDTTTVVLQAVSRAGENFDPELRMAYVRQELGQNTAVRVGRIRNPMYFDSDVSEIGYAYLTARPPIPVYNIVNSVTSLDGADIQFRHSFGLAGVLVHAFYGSNEYDHQMYNLQPREHAKVDIDDIRGLALSLHLPQVTMRASRTWAHSYRMRSSRIDQLNGGIQQMSGALRMLASQPAVPDFMQGALSGKADAIAAYHNVYDNKPVYTSVGFDGNYQNLRVMGEWVKLDSRSPMVGKYEGYQLTLGYAIGNFTPYVGYARQDRQDPLLDTRPFDPTGLGGMLPAQFNPDPALAMLQAGLDQAAMYADLSSRSVTAGVRWDFRENMAFKLQYDRIQTPGSSTPGSFSVLKLPFDNKVDLLSATLDIVF
ncbi:MAG: porin [Rhodocyclaceae bacterium]|jgi:hypothetical protein|nr:porin [Rhodocyclaceae bacterium]